MSFSIQLWVCWGIFYLTYGGKTEIEVDEVNCSKVRIELVFVLDSSSSIAPNDYELEKKFVVDLVSSLEVGQDQSRVGVVTFADFGQIEFGFKKYNNTKDVQNAVIALQQLDGITALGKALKLAGEGVLIEARTGIPKYLIVLTDGQNNIFPRPSLVTPALKNDGVTIVAVGIGSEVNEEELNGISSNNKFVNVSGFGQLLSFVEVLKNQICKTKVKYELITCEAEGDLSFIIDASNKQYIPIQKDLLSKVFKRLEISSKKQRVAIVVEGYDVVVPLNKISTLEEFNKYLTSATFEMENKGNSGMDVSARLLRENRNEVAKLVVLIRTSDSVNKSKDIQIARDLQNGGSNLLTIGIGKNVNEKHLDELSTTKKSLHPSKLTLDESYVSQISENICQNLRKIYKECMGKKIDIVFVLDSSSSVLPENWSKQLKFVARMISMLDVGNNTARIGAVYFSSEAYLGFKIGAFENKKDNMQAVTNLQYTEGGTATGNALKLAHQQILFERRKEAVSVIVLVTDGKSSIGIKPEGQASYIKNDGVHIICIGITNQMSRVQLTELSSTNQVYEISSFDSLETFSVEAITKEVCQAIRGEPGICMATKNVTRIEL